MDIFKNIRALLKGFKVELRPHRRVNGENLSNQCALAAGKLEKEDLGRERARQILLGQGRTDREVTLILNAAEEWELDFALLEGMDFKVIGDSVWIDAADQP